MNLCAIETNYIDPEGKLAKTTLQPYKVRGEAASALTIDDPFYRIAMREYDETVRAFNRLPVEVRKQYIALITSQLRCDNGAAPGDKSPKLSPEVRAEYLANVIKHGFSPENPFATIIKDNQLEDQRGFKRVFSVKGYPVDENRLTPVVVSFYMGTEAFERGNFYKTERVLSKLLETSHAGRATPSMN